MDNLGQILEGKFCNVSGPLVIISEPSDPRAENVEFTGLFATVSDLDYLLNVPREQEVLVQVTYHNVPRQPLLQGAFARVTGPLHVDYDRDGKPQFSLAAVQVEPEPGDPSTREYVERSLPMWNPFIAFTGVVVSIPVERQECRVCTLSLRVPRDECNCQPRGTCWIGQLHYSTYEVHCATPMNARRAHRRRPQLGDTCFVVGELVGQYQDCSLAPLVRVIEISVLPSLRQETPTPSSDGYDEEVNLSSSSSDEFGINDDFTDSSLDDFDEEEDDNEVSKSEDGGDLEEDDEDDNADDSNVEDDVGSVKDYSEDSE